MKNPYIFYRVSPVHTFQAEPKNELVSQEQVLKQHSTKATRFYVRYFQIFKQLLDLLKR